MQRDFKIGAAMGLLLIAVVSLWLAVQPSLSVKARMAEDFAVDGPAAPAPLLQNPSVPQSQPPPMLSADSAQPTQKIHIVRKGDTLSTISKQYYGTTAKWQKILDANRSTLKNPNSLTVGARLIIPD